MFIDGLTQLLVKESWVKLAGTATAPEAALDAFQSSLPHVIILVHASNQAPQSPDLLLDHYPDIPLIYADLNRDYFQVITSQCVSARRDNLLDVIRTLTVGSQSLPVEGEQ